jgi:cell division protein FtsB
MRKQRFKTSNLRQQVAVERKRRTIIFFTIIIIGLIYIGIALLMGEISLIKYVDLINKKKGLEREIAVLETENKTLKTKVEELRIDPFYIEKHAREEYGLAKPEEFIFQFQDNAQ